MKNDNNNEKRTDTENTSNEERRKDQSGNSNDSGVEVKESGVLDKKVEGGGVSVRATQEGSNQDTVVNNLPLDWTFFQIWNKSLEEAEQREITAREHIWATELGKAPIDVWLKMRGEALTNPPNARSLRKFEAGNTFEWIVGIILKRAGIIHSAQEHVGYQFEGLCKVTGKIDFIAGGKPDFEKAKKEVEELDLPESFSRGFKSIIAHFEEHYPNGLGLKPLEIKSLSAFMFDGLERTGKTLQIHRLQAYHYLKSKGMPQANIVYICRDDMRMIEVPIFLNDSVLEAEYRERIGVLSGYFQRNEQPPLEKPVVWDKDLLKFCKNFNVAYSGYLTKLYGFKDQAEFDEKYAPVTDRWNRVIKRAKANKKLTDKNLTALKEIEDAGFNLEELLAQMPEVVEEEETVVTE